MTQLDDSKNQTTTALKKLKNPKLVRLENQIEKIIESHTRRTNEEFRIIYCTSKCLAKEIALVVHTDIEENL